MDKHYYDWQGELPINEKSRDSNCHIIMATLLKFISLIRQSTTLSEVKEKRGRNYFKVKAMLLCLLVSYLCFE